MKRISWLLILFVLSVSCTKRVEVGQDEIGLVFSYWNGKSYDTFYEPGVYKISYFKGFTAAKIIEKSDTLEFNRIVNEDTLALTLIVSFRPNPYKNFELYDKLGLDYDKTFVRPLLKREINNIKAFKGTDNEIAKRLEGELKADGVVKTYLEITSIKIMAARNNIIYETQQPTTE